MLQRVPAPSQVAQVPKVAAPELLVQQQDGSMALVQPNLYRTTFENGQPVMVTLNPYSTQLVDNLNKMMGQEAVYDNTMNPQLAKLTATLRKRQGIPERGMTGVQRMVNPEEVVFRAVSPHGHVYWEINPSEQAKMAPGRVGTKSQHSSSSDSSNTASDLQNISDFSDDDNGRAASEMSRQSSSRFSESRPLIYSSSASTSPGHSGGTPAELHTHHHPSMRATMALPQRARQLPTTTVPRAWNGTPNYHEEVYAYAGTDFGQTDPTRQQQGPRSREYIMAKIADYTERNSNKV